MHEILVVFVTECVIKYLENTDSITEMCSRNTFGGKHIQLESLRSPLLIPKTFFLLFLSLTGGPAGKGGGQQDKNDGDALNFDPGYEKSKSKRNFRH